MKDLRSVSCDIMTIGQYLQPYERRLPVERYVTPEEFAEWKKSVWKFGLQTRRIFAAHALVVSRAPAISSILYFPFLLMPILWLESSLVKNRAKNFEELDNLQ
jgi:hypothetical protein